MKDPCDKCLVKVTCGYVCPDKENYRTLLRMALDHHKGSRLRYHDSYSHYQKLFRKNLESMSEIDRRKYSQTNE